MRPRPNVSRMCFRGGARLWPQLRHARAQLAPTNTWEARPRFSTAAMMWELYTQRRSRCLHSECFMQMYDNEVHVYVMQVRELTQFEQAVSTALFEDVSAFSHHVRRAAEPSIGACLRPRVYDRHAHCDTRSSRVSGTCRKIEGCRHSAK